MTVLILGANGFIGSALVRAILARTDWSVVGMDIDDHRLGSVLDDPRLQFVQGDIAARRAWVDARILECDVVLPLVAIATPAHYVHEPLRVFELTFEENLRIIRKCRAARKRLVFLSSSEVYGICQDPIFREDESVHVLGPVHKQRWIYGSCKELLERLIWAEGRAGALDFTLVRPFNWIGARLDSRPTQRAQSSRVVAQFLHNLIQSNPIQLVDGGKQKRCFTHIDDGVDCLLRILDNPGGRASGQIFNVGNPANECSIRELAETLRRLYARYPGSVHGALSEIEDISAGEFYGDGYQDVPTRRPDVTKARSLLDWQPQLDLEESLSRTLHGYLEMLAPAG